MAISRKTSTKRDSVVNVVGNATAATLADVAERVGRARVEPR
jgi:hypothetical protein